MKECGLQNINIGLESGDQNLLDSIRKGIDLEQVRRVVEWCGKDNLAINTYFYLMVGLPGQDWQSVLKSAAFLKENPPYEPVSVHPGIFTAMPYPGTEISRIGGVRLLRPDETSLNWPEREPDIRLSADGKLEGESFTETDDMTSQEIFEARAYLSNYRHVLLTHLHHPSLAVQHQYGNISDQMLYMLERRTMRDLIVRAQEGLTPERRKSAYEEMLERDGGTEQNVEDLSHQFDGRFKEFTSFLTSIGFSNGFDTMKSLSVANRIKWMRLCAILWCLFEKKFDIGSFTTDSEVTGSWLNELLNGVSINTLNTMLRNVENGKPLGKLSAYVTVDGNKASIFDLEFTLDSSAKTLTLDTEDIAPTPIGPEAQRLAL
jgi:hypothetical protein